MVKALIMNEDNQKYNILKLMVYNKTSEKKPKARIIMYTDYGKEFDYEDMNQEQFNKLKQFFEEN